MVQVTDADTNTDVTVLVREYWAAVSAVLRENSRRAPASSPVQVKLVEGGNDLGLGGRLDGSTLILDADIVGNPCRIFTVVCRECVGSVMSDKVCREAVDDLGMALAYSLLDTKDQERIAAFWRECVRDKYVDRVTRYSPARFFTTLHDLTDGRGLWEIVNEIEHMSRHGLSLDFEDYVRYCERRYRLFVTTLTAADVRMLRVLLNEPMIPKKQLARRTGFTYQWVSERISYLRKKNVLRQWTTVRFSKIGIRMFNLLMDSEDPNENLTRLFDHCPFVYSMRNIITGRWRLLVTLSIPDNHDSIRALNTFEREIRKRGISVEHSEVMSSGANFSLEYYDPDRGVWNIPWSIVKTELERIHRDGLASAMPKFYVQKEELVRDLDGLDMVIARMVHSGRQSVSTIRSELRVGQEKVASKLKRMRKLGVLGTIVELHNVGLVENAFILSHEPSAGESLAAWAIRLPRSIVAFDIDDSMIMMCGLPCGGGYGLMRTIEGLHPGVSGGLIGDVMQDRWIIPFELWDEDRHEWNCPDEQIGLWLDCIR
ncbi:MAG: helix-turn-helix domain-containing protein [Candidatus Thorarchaeota archaeon]